MNLQIASAAEEQGVVVEEINRNIVNIDEGADQSRRALEESFSQFHQIEKTADDLSALVGHFQVSSFKNCRQSAVMYHYFFPG